MESSEVVDSSEVGLSTGQVIDRLDPGSVAGVLVRDLGSIEKAFRYAQKMARRCAGTNPTMAESYAAAAGALSFFYNKE
jgi:hypothetical protein